MIDGSLVLGESGCCYDGLSDSASYEARDVQSGSDNVLYYNYYVREAFETARASWWRIVNETSCAGGAVI